MVAEYGDYGREDPDLFDAADSWADLDIAAFLETSQGTHTDRLEQELAAIEAQLAERDRLHQELVADLEWKIDRYTGRLEHLYTIGKGRLDGTRDELKDRIVAFEAELREEHREHWRDRQELEQARRDLVWELAEVEAADETLSELL